MILSSRIRHRAINALLVFIVYLSVGIYTIVAQGQPSRAIPEPGSLAHVEN